MVNDVYGKLKNGLLRLAGRGVPAFDSAEYWDARYRNNGNSGAGSYMHLAAFKANVLNAFVREKNIHSVVEFGCGDGNQLKLADYPRYTGFDVSQKSIEICRKAFADDRDKSFHAVSEAVEIKADLSLSLDVIYHLVEDEVYHRYMDLLFRSSTRWVIVYSSNIDVNDYSVQSIHVRHRRFTDWVQRAQSDYTVVEHIPNTYPIGQYGAEGSFADFYIFQKRS
jgi:SAM-dependent methyltransferase